MFFRKKETVTKTPRQKAWEIFAKRLGFVPAEGSIGLIRNLLNEPMVNIIALYKTEVEVAEQKLQMFFLDYQQPNAKPVPQLVSVCMLVLAEKSFISLKASRKPHKVMEKLGASAIGGEIVPFDEASFSEDVTVYSRNVEATQKLLHARAREILHRALYERGISPTFLLGEKVLLFSHAVTLAKPTPLESLEGLAADILSLYAAFSVTNSVISNG